MRTNLKNKLQFPVLPVTVIGSYDKKGKPNAMTAAWSTINDWDQVYVILDKHKTTDNIKATKAFTLAFATKDTMVYADYFGLVSGKKVDKIKKSKVKVIKSKYVNAPIFPIFPLTIECKVVSLKDSELVGKIINTSVDNKYLTKGKLDIDKMKVLTYDTASSCYRILGPKVAKAFNIGKKIK